MLGDLRDRLPDHARDLRLNLSAIGAPGELSPRLSWGVALVAALSTGHREVIAAIEADAAAHLDDAAHRAVRTAASLMAMNNVYYRATHWLGGDYAKLPARLRMQAIANPRRRQARLRALVPRRQRRQRLRSLRRLPRARGPCQGRHHRHGPGHPPPRRHRPLPRPHPLKVRGTFSAPCVRTPPDPER
jgi:hypothetical protein